ncbi:hypothetical protein [Thomasclavelia sp.]
MMKYKKIFIITITIILSMIHIYLLYHYGCLRDEYNIVGWSQLGNCLWLGLLFSIIALIVVSIYLKKSYKILLIIWSIYFLFSTVTIYQYYNFAKEYPLGVKIEYE